MPISAELAFYQVVPQKYMFISYGFSWTQLLILVYIPVMLLISIFSTKSFLVKAPLKKSLIIVALICVGTYLSIMKIDKPAERISYKMEVAAYNNHWDEVIEYVAKNRQLCTVKNYDRDVNFYYDMALAKKNQLAVKMLTYPQLMGIDALFIDEPVVTALCLPISMFYYNVGLITNALHFAFEAQTSYPTSHYTMRYVIDCLILIGDYNTALEFMNKYEKNMFSRKYISNRKKIIQKIDDNSDPNFTKEYIHNIRATHPTEDFYLQGRQNNMLRLLMSNPKNQMASQYLLCSALLQNDLNLFVQILLSGVANVDLNNLPRIYQEAILLYWATSQDVKPETKQIKVSSYLKDSFSNFVKIMTSKAPNYEQVIAKKYPNTYWQYYCIDSPVVKGAYVILK